MLLFFRSPASVKPPTLPLTQKLLQLNPLGVLFILTSLIFFSLCTQYAGQTHSWSSSTVISLLIGSVFIAITFVIEETWSGERAPLQPRLFRLRAVAIVYTLLFFLTGL